MADENQEVFFDDEDEDSIITLTDEDGNDVDFILLDAITMDEKNYVVLIPAEDEDPEAEEEEVLIMRVDTDENGEDFFTGVDDEEEAQRVFEIFQTDEEDYEFGDAE